MVATPADVERFAFCAHAWQLGKGEAEPDRGTRLQHGVAAHRRIAGLVHEARRAHDESATQLRWSFRILAVAAASTLLALQGAAFERTAQGYAFLAASLVVLNCSVGLLTLALYDRRRAEQIRERIGLEEEPRVDGVDVPRVHDPEWGLEGDRGCVLLASEGRVIPIDARAGRTPKKPHPDHELHMAGRLRLEEVLDGEAPGYGLIAYPQGVFRVDWDPDRQQRLAETLQAIEVAQATGHADRDHGDPRRCRACRFRGSCEQSL